MVLNGPEWSWMVLNCPEWSWMVLNGAEWCWMVVNAPECSWMLLIAPECSWILLNAPEWLWMVLNGAEWCWMVLNGAEWLWMVLEWFYLSLIKTKKYFWMVWMVLNGQNVLNGVRFPPSVWIKIHPKSKAKMKKLKLTFFSFVLFSEIWPFYGFFWPKLSFKQRKWPYLRK